MEIEKLIKNKEDKNFIKKIYNIFELDINSIHGISHWLSVYKYTNILSQNEKDINKKFLFYFAFLHDSHRQNENIDINHGHRAADFIYQNKDLFKLNNSELHQLYIACKYHNTNKKISDKTIKICVDADRLDLKRFNYKILENKLYTKKAKKLKN